MDAEHSPVAADVVASLQARRAPSAGQRRHHSDAVTLGETAHRRAQGGHLAGDLAARDVRDGHRRRRQPLPGQDVDPIDPAPGHPDQELLFAGLRDRDVLHPQGLDASVAVESDRLHERERAQKSSPGSSRVSPRRMSWPGSSPAS